MLTHFYSVVTSDRRDVVFVASSGPRWDRRSPPPPSPRRPAPSGSGQIITHRNYGAIRPTPSAAPADSQFEDAVLDGPDHRKSEVPKLERKVASSVRGIQKLKSEIWQLKREKRKDQKRKEGKDKKRVRWSSVAREREERKDQKGKERKDKKKARRSSVN